MGVYKAPSHVGHVAAVGAGWPDQIRVLASPVLVPRAKDRRTQAIAPRKGIKLVLDRINVIVVWIVVAGCVGRGVGCSFVGLGFAAGQPFVVQRDALLQPLLRTVSVRCGQGQTETAKR